MSYMRSSASCHVYMWQCGCEFHISVSNDAPEFASDFYIVKTKNQLLSLFKTFNQAGLRYSQEGLDRAVSDSFNQG